MLLSLFYYIILAVFVVGSLLLTGIVLLQRPKSEGLGSAFGGNITENMFGAQTTDVLTKFTIYLGSAFFIATLLLAMLTARIQDGSVESSLIQQATTFEESTSEAETLVEATEEEVEINSEDASAKIEQPSESVPTDPKKEE